MKSLLFLLFLGFQVPAAYSSEILPKHEVSTEALQNIENGWYEATVSYFNPKTFTKSNYRLNVKVEYNRVTAIDFGNGGSVHAGYNNSGYSYSGGTLSFRRDYSGNIVSASTRVTITEGYESTYYDIVIE